MTDAHAHARLIVGQIVNSVRNCLAQVFVGKVMPGHSFWVPFPSKGFHAAVDVLKLGITVRMLFTFNGLAIRWRWTVCSCWSIAEETSGHRTCEIVMAGKMAAGELETTWFERHGSAPITELPEAWPDDYKALVNRLIEVIESNPNIALN